MPVQDRIYTTNTFDALVANPLNTLQNNDLVVNGLPVANDGTVHNLWFAARGISMAIDQSDVLAAGLVTGPPDCSIQRAMVVSPMRSNALPPGALPGNRHEATGQLNPGAVGANLWVTEMQTGCTILIADWGGGLYSMIHLQPSQDQQFNQVGQAVLNAGETARNAYQNAWLKQEVTTIMENTGPAPQSYIMIQSMFETARGNVTQVIGVRNGNQFQFFRQRQTPPATRVVEQLQWTPWRTYVPYSSY
jgi:hypothetical protein